MPTESTAKYYEFVCTDPPLPGAVGGVRPADRPREVPSEPMPDPIIVEFVDLGANLPPGTLAAPRPPGRERLIDEDIPGPSPTEADRTA
jgi:hypothetical protein